MANQEQSRAKCGMYEGFSSLKNILNFLLVL